MKQRGLIYKLQGKNIKRLGVTYRIEKKLLGVR